MTLQTDLNVFPYYDDYDESKNYYKILFKSSKQVQSRELNQLQRILQSQIEVFGETILTRGSIVKGGNFYDYKNIPYVKISDNNINTQPIVIQNYIGAKMVGVSSGVEAIVVTAEPGYESKSPELNTLYVRYTTSGQDANGVDIKTFLVGEIIEGYVDGVRNPELDIAVTTYGVDPNPIGNGYAVSCGDGILFQKGFFINFGNQIAVVEKYNNKPHEKVIGFTTEEQIVNHNADVSLRDNAYGSPNYNAPGADRINLTPRLVVKMKDEVADDINFMTIQEYENGLLINKRTGTVFSNAIFKEFEQRTYDESGNYTVSGHTPAISTSPGSQNIPVVSIPRGVSYVNGKRVETSNTLFLDIPTEQIETDLNENEIAATYGNYMTATDYKGVIDMVNLMKVDFYDTKQTTSGVASGTKIGSGYVNMFDFVKNELRIYFNEIVVDAGDVFGNIKSMVGPTGYVNFILENGKAVLKETSQRSLTFPLPNIGLSGMGETYSYVTYRKRSIAANGAGSIVVNFTGDTFAGYASGSIPASQLQGIFIRRSNDIFKPVAGTVSGDRKQMTLDFGAVLGTTTAVHEIYYKIQMTNHRYAGKTLETTYVRVNLDGIDKKGPIYLGYNDVHSIESIHKGSDLSFTEITPPVANVTNSFDLHKNIKQDLYDTSYLKIKTGHTFTDSDYLLIKLKVFKRNTTGSYGNGAYSYLSYPIDDTTPVLPTNKIRSSSLTSVMRNSIDIRPSREELAPYVGSPTAPTIAVITQLNTFKGVNITVNTSSGTLIGPVVGDGFNINYKYSLPRIDLIVVNEKGEFALQSGQPSENPKPPQPLKKSMVVGELFVPAPPIYTPQVASRLNKLDNAIKLTKNKNVRYTMRDIGDIDDRISNMEYYAVLSAMEASADSMVIKGSDGLDRFKNGIFVENFESMAACDVRNENYFASVDQGENTLYPAFRSYNLKLTHDGFSQTKNMGNATASLAHKEVNFIQQNFATRYRNCVTDFYNFDGTGYVYPEYDDGYDETVAPSVNVTLDIAGAFTEYTNNLNQLMPIKTTNSSKTSVTGVNSKTNTAIDRDVDVSRNGRTTSTTTTTTSTTTTTTTTNTKTVNTTTTSKGSVNVSSVDVTKQKVGEFITDVQFSPYLRANILRLAFFGLRPNTRFWVWFDGKPQTHLCAPATLDGDDIKDIRRTAKYGTPIYSDENGELIFVYRIPKETFYVGDRDLIVMDVDSMSSEEAATSTGSITYRGFNFSVEKTGLEVSTRSPNFKSKVVKTSTNKVTRNSTTSTSVDTNVDVAVVRRPEPRWIGGGDGEGNSGQGSDGGGDPIAQTFVVNNSYTDKDAIMITKVSVPFRKKSGSRGITLQVRKVENGYPGPEILPFSSVRLTAASVKVSANGSAFTDFVFKSPVALATGESYAIVLIPDGNSPDYLVFTAKTGEADFKSGVRVSSDVNSGTLFTSTNNRAWTPYQDENMSFKISRAEYTANTGFVNLKLEDYEFLDLSAYIGTFIRGETVFKIKPFVTGTISTTAGSNTIRSNVNLNNTFEVGDTIAIHNQTDDTYDVAKIKSIVNNTTAILDEYMKDDVTGRKFFKTITGTVDYFNKKDPVRLFLRYSSAKTGDVFANGDAIRGELSNAAGEIGEVMSLPISYLQPNIYQTNFKDTSTKLAISRQTNASGGTSSSHIAQSFDDNNRLVNMPTVIKSRSKEIEDNAGARSFQMRVTLNANGAEPKTVSPHVDYEVSGITVYEYLLNPATPSVVQSEKNDDGECVSKYISKPITLRNGFDAEDFKIWLTAYKPLGAEINVYVKFISSIDNTPENEMVWTLMELSDSKNFRSSSTNLNDYKEFEYNIPTQVAGPNGGAYIASDGSFAYQSADGSVFNNFVKFVVKITLNSTTHNIIPKVKDLRGIALS